MIIHETRVYQRSQELLALCAMLTLRFPLWHDRRRGETDAGKEGRQRDREVGRWKRKGFWRLERAMSDGDFDVDHLTRVGRKKAAEDRRL